MIARVVTPIALLTVLAGCPEPPPEDLTIEERIERLEPTADALRRQREQGIVNPLTVRQHVVEHEALVRDLVEELAADQGGGGTMTVRPRPPAPAPPPQADEGPIRIQVIDIPKEEPPPSWLPLVIAGGFGGGLMFLATLAYLLLTHSSEGEGEGDEETPTP